MFSKNNKCDTIHKNRGLVMSAFMKTFFITTILVAAIGSFTLISLKPPTTQKKDDESKDGVATKIVRTSALDGVYFPKVLKPDDNK